MDLADDDISYAEGLGHCLACCPALRSQQAHATSSCSCDHHMSKPAMLQPWGASSHANCLQPSQIVLGKAQSHAVMQPHSSASIILTNVHVSHAAGLGRLQPIITVGGPANICGGQDVHLRVPFKVLERVFEPHCSQIDGQSAMRKAGVPQPARSAQAMGLGVYQCPCGAAPVTGQVACYRLGLHLTEAQQGSRPAARLVSFHIRQHWAWPHNKQVAGCRACLDPTNRQGRVLEPSRQHAEGLACVHT